MFGDKPCHISSESGLALGMAAKFMGMPDQFLGHLVRVFVKDWEFLGRDPSVRANFVHSVVVEGFLRFEDEDEKISPLFESRTGRLMMEVDELVWYPSQAKKYCFKEGQTEISEE